jgi:hypothetical protein
MPAFRIDLQRTLIQNVSIKIDAPSLEAATARAKELARAAAGGDPLPEPHALAWSDGEVEGEIDVDVTPILHVRRKAVRS